MSVEWIVIEIFVNVIEVCAIFYLLCSKLLPKYNTFIPTLIFILINICYLSLPLFVFELPAVEIVFFICCLIYILFFRVGVIWIKIFWLSLSYSLTLVIAFFTPSILAIITGVTSVDIMTQPSYIRLLSLITAKTIHVILFYILSLNRKKNNLYFTPSLIICFIIPLISFLSLVYIYYILVKNINYNVPDILIYVVSISDLSVNIIVFILYEWINKEAEKNYLLMSKHKQYEITEQHNNQIVEIYSKIREWRHDYSNHMQLIMTYLEKSEKEDIDKAINYIHNLDEKIRTTSTTISTGNHIVDAIISAKITLANSFNIKFLYNIFLIEDLTIVDSDLCALLSNLLDNAIEACSKIENKRYINLEIIIIKNQLHIKISNSTNGKYNKENGKLKTTKQGQLHGIGLKHIESIIEEYNGIYNIKAEDESFTTQISIPSIIK